MKSLGCSIWYRERIRSCPTSRRCWPKLALTPEQAAYIGDDTIDLPVMQAVVSASPWPMPIRWCWRGPTW